MTSLRVGEVGNGDTSVGEREGQGEQEGGLRNVGDGPWRFNSGLEFGEDVPIGLIRCGCSSSILLNSTKDEDESTGSDSYRVCVRMCRVIISLRHAA